MLTLRPITAADLPLDRMPDGGFDDFGPMPPMTSVPSCRLDDDLGQIAVDLDGTLIGTMSWVWLRYGPNASSRGAMIGIGLHPAHRGQGHGTEAQRQLADLFFRHTNTNRVEARTHIRNLAEQRSLEKAGFTREGVARGVMFHEGEYHDDVCYSLLRAEWVARG